MPRQRRGVSPSAHRGRFRSGRTASVGAKTVWLPCWRIGRSAAALAVAIERRVVKLSEVSRSADQRSDPASTHGTPKRDSLGSLESTEETCGVGGSVLCCGSGDEGGEGDRGGESHFGRRCSGCWSRLRVMMYWREWEARR